MKAAVVTSYAEPPRYQSFPDPATAGPHDLVVEVVAAGLHPRVRSQAAGTHYTSTEDLPLVPGIDGVGRDAEGRLRYFVLPDTSLGSMAQRTVVDVRRSIVLPDDADPVMVAAAMNPAMSSWVALRQRIDFRTGQSVVVLGATGSAGRLAVQVAAHLGASQVVAVGRDPERLAECRQLGATQTVQLGRDDSSDRLAEAGSTVDVVLDYLWGAPTRDALLAIVPARQDDGQTLTWVQVGSVAGPECAVPSAALRATRLQLVGSGQGSVGTREIVTELAGLAEAVTAGVFRLDVSAVPLTDVETAWQTPMSGSQRVVLTL